MVCVAWVVTSSTKQPFEVASSECELLWLAFLRKCGYDRQKIGLDRLLREIFWGLSTSSSKERVMGRKRKGCVRFRLDWDLRTILGHDNDDGDDSYKTRKERKYWIGPGSPFLHRWNRFFLISCLVSLFVDPLFFFLPRVDYERSCFVISRDLLISVTTIRTITDFIYAVHMVLRFRTAYIQLSPGLFRRGELVTNSRDIAARYFKYDLWCDIVAVLPMPQVFLWLVIPHISGPPNVNMKNTLRYIVIFQFIPRMLRILPLLSEIIKSAGTLLETAWVGAAFNLLLYILASHVVGSSWYFLSVERQATCWNDMCRIASGSNCDGSAFDCSERIDAPWFANFTTASNVFCNNGGNDPNADRFKYGIFEKAIVQAISSMEMWFSKTYFYCLWLGLLSLSSLTQTLEVSTYIGEVIFTIFILIVGLLLFAFLIGNMQVYLQSLTVRHQEMQVTRSRNREKWMRYRNLPDDLKQRVRRYHQYKWSVTQGVDEETLLQDIPRELRRDIKQYLCLNHVRSMGFTKNMDINFLAALCERMKFALCTEGDIILREGDPVNGMFFVISGNLETTTTNGGRAGFSNIGLLTGGEFCGEELITWAFDPNPQQKHLPISTHTVRAITEVEGFTMTSDDWNLIAKQMQDHHSQKVLKHTFRYYSYHWRTWATCFIQAAWRRYVKRRLSQLRDIEWNQYLAMQEEATEEATNKLSLGATCFVSKFAINSTRGVQRLRRNFLDSPASSNARSLTCHGDSEQGETGPTASIA